MKSYFLAALAFVGLTFVESYCPNLCSGHGVCGSGDKCTCYEYIGTSRGDYTNAGSAYATSLRAAWTGADCSLRTCPLAYSWAGATPNGLSASVAIGSIAAEVITLTGGVDLRDPSTLGGFESSLSVGSKVRVVGTSNELLTIRAITYTTETVITTVETPVNTGGTLYYAPTEYELAAAPLDAKDANGAHAMLECSGQGICDRSTGNCDCFPGYEGEACTRSVCPNNCSGNGICLSAKRLATDAGHSYQYAWDADKHYGCKCDAGFRGPDCSLQECPSDYDPLYGCGGGQCNLGTTDNAGNVCANAGNSDCTNNEQRDCSGRGICDYESGLCKCFSGFFGEACEKQTILI